MSISKQLYANNAKSTLPSIVSSSDVTISVSDGSLFPSPGIGEYFLVTLEYGGVIEVIRVQGKTGNNFTSCLRGQENTTANGFPAGARVECRITRDTLAGYAKKSERVDEISSVDALSPPLTSNSNSYICSTLDDFGNPILAFKNTNNGNLWRFLNHSLVKVTGSTSASTTTSITSIGIASNIVSVQPGKYIIQFVSGASIGVCRAINASSTNVVSWTTPLSTGVNPGDQFEIYKSNASNLTELIAAAGTIPSDPAKANLSNPTFTGLVTIPALKVSNMIDTKVTLVANSATTTLTLSAGSVFKVTIAASTLFDFNGPPAGTDIFSFTLITVNDSTAGRAVSFPAGKMQWAGNITPPRTTTANAVDVWTFFTDDAGTTWKGSLAISDVR